MTRCILYIALVLLASSCGNGQQSKLLAEAYGNELYEDEIANLMSKNTSAEDSIFITKEYINLWISKQVLLHEADKTLSDSEKDKSEELEQYKVDLLTYEVLNKLALQELDTSFGDTELIEYYEANTNEFELSDHILKIIFFKIPQRSKDIDMLWSTFKADDATIYPTLISLAKKGGNYFTDADVWVNFDDILKEIPINTYNQEHYLSNHKYIKLNDGSFVYFIKIIDFKIRSSVSPFSMEKENIKKILLLKRQQKLVREIETKLLDKAYSNNNIETF